MALGTEKHNVGLGEAILHQAGNDAVEGIDFSASMEDPLDLPGDILRNGARGVRNAAKVVIGDLLPRAPDWIVDKLGPGEQHYDVTRRRNPLSGTGSYVDDIMSRRGIVRKVGAAVLNPDKLQDDAWNVIGSGKWQIRPSKTPAHLQGFSQEELDKAQNN